MQNNRVERDAGEAPRTPPHLERLIRGVRFHSWPRPTRDTMNDHFLREALWVLFTYGWPYVACALAISTVMVVWGSRRVRRGSRKTVLTAAILVLWLALILGVETGYHAWQSTPNPPEEAFSDTGGPFVVLFLGWLPGLVVLELEHLVLRRCWRVSAPPPTPPPAPPSNPA